MARKERNKKKGKLGLLSSLLIIMSLILVVSLVFFDALPITYLGVIIGIIVLIDIILIVMMKKKKKKGFVKCLSFLLSIMMGVFSFYILKTAGLINNLNLNYKTYNYSVVVLKSSNYDKIGDIKGETLGYYKTDGDECKKSLAKLSKKVKTDNKDYDDVNEMAKDLIDGQVESILIEDSYLKILDENSSQNVENSEEKESNGIVGFSDDTKVIYKFTIIVKTSNISKDLDVTRKPFNIYISGIDTYGEISSVSRSDVNMVVTVNPKSKQILLTSIPRDYYVKLHGKSGYNDKLTHAGLYGVDMSIQTIEDLLDIDINYYVKVNFSSVIDIVNAIGGVEVYSDYDFTSIDGFRYSKGYNKVNGEEALSFARERKAFAAGDNQRVKDQQALLEAMFRKCTKPSIIAKYNNLLNSVSGSFVTNMPADRLKALIRLQMYKKYSWTITSNSLEGSNSSNYTYSYSSQKLYVMEPIEESVSYASELIKSVFDGEKLDPSYDGNASDVHKVTSSKNSSSNSSNNNDTKKTVTTSEPVRELNVRLVKDSVTFTEGDSYIYHGYIASYGDKDVTNNSTVVFTINGNSFTDYRELVSFVSNLSVGQYNIVYKIKYGSVSKSLNQTVIIEKKYSYEENDSSNLVDDTTSSNSIDDSVNEESNE